MRIQMSPEIEMKAAELGLNFEGNTTAQARKKISAMIAAEHAWQYENISFESKCTSRILVSKLRKLQEEITPQDERIRRVNGYTRQTA